MVSIIYPAEKKFNIFKTRSVLVFFNFVITPISWTILKEDLYSTYNLLMHSVDLSIQIDSLFLEEKRSFLQHCFKYW